MPSSQPVVSSRSVLVCISHCFISPIISRRLLNRSDPRNKYSVIVDCTLVLKCKFYRYKQMSPGFSRQAINYNNLSFYLEVRSGLGTSVFLLSW